MTEQKQEIYDLLYDIVGEGGCAGACSEAELYQEEGEWKLFLCGFMAPWSLGNSLDEVEAHLREYADQGFGMGA